MTTYERGLVKLGFSRGKYPSFSDLRKGTNAAFAWRVWCAYQRTEATSWLDLTETLARMLEMEPADALYAAVEALGKAP